MSDIPDGIREALDEPDPELNDKSTSEEVDAIIEYTDTKNNAPVVSPTKLFDKFEEITEQITDRYSEDREQIEKTISYLEGVVLGSQKKVPNVYIEQLVSALRAKAEINANATRLLDSIAKILSAGKGANVFVQQNVSSSQDEADKLLKQMEEYDANNST